MNRDVQDAVKQIDEALAQFEGVQKGYLKHSRHSEGDWIEAPTEAAAMVIINLRSTLERLSPEGEKATQKAVSYPDRIFHSTSTSMRQLAAALRVLKADYQAGRLKRFREMVVSDLFSDFLEMAEYLLSDEKLKDPAAVIAGGVLEQHLRKLCDKHCVLTTFTDAKGNICPKRLDTMNSELAKAGAYDKNEQKQVTAWAGLRNEAAHGHWNTYTADQVSGMVLGIRGFLSRNPA
jgi:hypothetical protein